MARIFVVLLCLVMLAGCARKKQAQVGPLKDWIVGTWIRNDDHIDWNFAANNEVMTGGRAPIGGSYSVEEPNKVQVHIAGANAVTASMMLGLKVDENQNLYANFVVDGDEMRIADVPSDVIFIKK